MYLDRITRLFLCFSFLSIPYISLAQEISFFEKFDIKPIVGIQLWASLSHKGMYFDDSLQAYQDLDFRYNMEIRRTRVGFSAKPTKRLKFTWVSALDNVGRDVYSGLTGGANNGGFPAAGLWDANFQWQVLKDKQSMFLTAGYFVPHLGRESYTSAFNVSSLEKSWSQNYIRRHLTGTGPGRTLGFNLGGQLYKEDNFLNFSYNLGAFSPLSSGIIPSTSGREASALFVGHGILHLGQAESSVYSRGHKVNYQGSRKGLSIGFGGSHQAATDLFALSQSASIDFLFNYGPLNLDGDLTYLFRQNTSGQKASGEVLHLRASYNLYLKAKGQILEPMILFTSYRGEMNASQQALAQSLGMLSGQDQLIDIGINWWIKPKLKLGIHYNLRSGDLGEAQAGSPINNYYFQGGAGAIQRPNWLGISVQLQL